MGASSSKRQKEEDRQKLKHALDQIEHLNSSYSEEIRKEILSDLKKELSYELTNRDIGLESLTQKQDDLSAMVVTLNENLDNMTKSKTEEEIKTNQRFHALEMNQQHAVTGLVDTYLETKKTEARDENEKSHHRIEALERKEKINQGATNQHEEKLALQETMLKQHQKSVDETQKKLDEQREILYKHRDLLDSHHEKLNRHEENFNETQETLSQHQDLLTGQKETLDKHQANFDETQKGICRQQKILNKHQANFDETLKEMSRHQETLSSQQHTLNKHQDLMVGQQKALKVHQEHLGQVLQLALQQEHHSTDSENNMILTPKHNRRMLLQALLAKDKGNSNNN